MSGVFMSYTMTGVVTQIVKVNFVTPGGHQADG